MFDMKYNVGRFVWCFVNVNLIIVEWFEWIYFRNVWGGEEGEFYFGLGLDLEGIELYIKMVFSFIRE